MPKELKECISCHWALPRSEFHRNCKTKDGLVGRCNLCTKEQRVEYYQKNRQELIEYSKKYQVDNREKCNEKSRRWANKNKGIKSAYARKYHKKYPLKRRIKTLSKHGLTMDDYALLMEQQNGLCAICGIPQVEMNRKFYVDHCHETGKVRGLLCIKCNTGIGNLNDNLQVLKNAVTYLEKHTISHWK